MLASKVIEMMCQYLEWQLIITPVTLHEFEEMVKKDFIEGVAASYTR
jgi:hypothetical protein